MAKYIDADEVLKLAEKGILVSNGNYKSVVSAINAIPAADVVEVVRCKDCKYYTHMWYCEAWNNSPGFPAVSDDMFCSLAERREDE